MLCTLPLPSGGASALVELRRRRQATGTIPPTRPRPRRWAGRGWRPCRQWRSAPCPIRPRDGGDVLLGPSRGRGLWCGGGRRGACAWLGAAELPPVDETAAGASPSVSWSSRGRGPWAVRTDHRGGRVHLRLRDRLGAEPPSKVYPFLGGEDHRDSAVQFQTELPAVENRPDGTTTSLPLPGLPWRVKSAVASATGWAHRPQATPSCVWVYPFSRWSTTWTAWCWRSSAHHQSAGRLTVEDADRPPRPSLAVMWKPSSPVDPSLKNVRGGHTGQGREDSGDAESGGEGGGGGGGRQATANRRRSAGVLLMADSWRSFLLNHIVVLLSPVGERSALDILSTSLSVAMGGFQCHRKPAKT